MSAGLALLLAVAAAGAQPAPPLPRDRRRVQIAAGDAHTCVLREHGDVVCWGANHEGQVDPTNPRRVVAKPVKVFAVDDAIAIAAGSDATCALLKGGKTVCWGVQGVLLGRRPGSETPVPEPAPIAVCPAPCPAAPHLIAVGTGHACVAIGASVACWGTNDSNQSGAAGRGPVLDPVRVDTGRATRLALGALHGCALTGAGEVRCWGDNFYNQRGDWHWSKGPPREQPFPIAGFNGAVDIAAGTQHTCAVDAAGGVSCVGHGSACQIGRQARAAGPVVVPGVADAVAISARSSSTCAVLRAGEVMCWGSARAGQLGNGRIEDHEVSGANCTPTRVTGLADAIQVAVGGKHACALRRSGQVVCWGSNSHGQIGRGNRPQQTTPIAVDLP